MNAFDFFRPITYNTDVLSVVHNYNNGIFPYANPYTNFATPNFTYQNPFMGSVASCWNYNNYGSSNNSNKLTYQENCPYYGQIYNFSGGTKTSSSNSSELRYDNNCQYFNNIYNFSGKSSVNNSSSTKSTSSSSAIDQSQKSSSKAETKANKSTATPQSSSNIGKSLATNASKYLGYSEKNGQSKIFSDSGEWCADFVTYVTKETYKEKGLTLPNGFGNHRVENLKQWGIDNNKYLSLTDKSNKAETIKNNVKIGDILILRENGASHTGIVSKINKKDGSFETIEGNVSINGDDKVVRNKYSANFPNISGFVQLT
jgi:hypothetical protein